MTYALLFKLCLTVAIVAVLAGFATPARHTQWWKGFFFLSWTAIAIALVGGLWMLP